MPTADSPDEPALLLAHCGTCGAWTYPAHAWGCRACGAPAAALQRLRPPHAPRLLESITLHAELVPGLPVPCVIGEVQLAPGLVEEALIAAHDASRLAPGLRLRAQALPPVEGGTAQRWQFHPDPEAP